MNLDHKKIQEEKDLENLDRMVAEEIFGFEIKEKQTSEHSYVQVIGENAEEPQCPLCYCRKPEYWIPDQLKRYTFHMTFAMEAAKKVGLFDEYSLRQKDDGKWSVGRYDEKTYRFVDVVTGDYPAEVISKAALIYHRMPKKKKKEKRIPKEEPLPPLVLRMIREEEARSGCWEGETEDGQRVVMEDSITVILITIDGVTRKIPLAYEEHPFFNSLPLSYALRKLKITLSPWAKFYRACTCCNATVEVGSLQEMDVMKEIFCKSCADWVHSIPRQVKSLHKLDASEWTGTLADGSPFKVIWDELFDEFLMYVDGKLFLCRDLHGDEWDRPSLERLSRTDEMLRYTNLHLAGDADLSYHCYVCKKKIPASSIKEMDESYNMCPCWEKENEEWFENFGRNDKKPRKIKTEPVKIQDEPEKKVEFFFPILYDPKRQTLFDRRVYFRNEDVADYGITRPDLVTIHFDAWDDFQYMVNARSIPRNDDIRRRRSLMCLTPFLEETSEPFELTEEEEKKLEEAAIRRAIKKLKSLGVPERLEFYRLFDLEKKEFFHDCLVYASLEEAAGEIRKNRSAHPSLRAIRFQVEMTKKGELECTCSFVEPL
jgi:hypothetical protein